MDKLDNPHRLMGPDDHIEVPTPMNAYVIGQELKMYFASQTRLNFFFSLFIQHTSHQSSTNCLAQRTRSGTRDKVVEVVRFQDVINGLCFCSHQAAVAMASSSSLVPAGMENFVVGLIGMGDMGKMYAERLSAAGWR